MFKEIKLAAELSNKAQRNWDHGITIPKKDINTLIHTIIHAPTKQNETHYKVYYTTNPKLIYNIYYYTKQFSVIDNTEFTDDKGRTPDNYNVRNSQVNANLLFAFCDDWNQENSRALPHRLVEEREAHPIVYIEREKQRYISTGVATGELILAANLLGYRTGLCTAFDWTELQKFFEGNKVNLLIGVGKPHPDKDRREHEEVYNKDIFLQSHKTGPDNEKWKFPTFKKEVSIVKL